MKATLRVDVNTNWGVIPAGTKVELLDDNTPLRQSYRARAIGAADNQVFPVIKTYLTATVQLD